MSGIVGIANLDGELVDNELLKQMTAAMENRAPDDSGVWCSKNIGFGHAMLRISPESVNENQPCTLDNKIWITADAHINGRVELVNLLRSSGLYVQNDAHDSALILHAYNVFGESFLEHLIGDFAFVIWDDSRKSLICVRDHFGVRPFFYVKMDKVFLFASDIDALLKHPAVAKELDEEFIADFLFFGGSQEADTSIYKNIRRLPAASRIIVNSNGFHIRKYWEAPLHKEIRYKNDSEYTDQFQELFAQAINDRSRTNHIALELSGGMDSTSIAAIAAENAKKTGLSVTAHTVTCHGLFPDDQEGYYAGTVASHLEIPTVYQASEDYDLFERFDNAQLYTSEPFANPDLAMHHDKLKQIINSGARVLLSGQIGDGLFNGSSTYYSHLLRSGQLMTFLSELYQHVYNNRSLAGIGLRSGFLHSLGKEPWQPDLPNWINPDFMKRVQFKDRWDSGWQKWNDFNDAYQQLQRPWFSQVFESYESLKLPVVARHPFSDVRLVTFLLGLPNYIKSDKDIMRKAMRGKLPTEILSRPKETLAGDIARAKFIGGLSQVRDKRFLADVSNSYINHGQYRDAFKEYLCGKKVESTWTSWLMTAPVALDYWLYNTMHDNGI